MGNLVSTLTLRLIDGVTANAGKVEHGLKKVDRAAKGVRGGMAGAAATVAQRGSLLTRNLVAAGGMLGGAALVKRAVTEYADFGRSMTRIGNKADASGKQVAAAARSVREMAHVYALPTSEMVEGLDTLVETGMDLPQAMGFLPSVAAAAQASGAAIKDMAESAAALSNSFGVTGPEMAAVFDALVKAGNLGQFELKDMATYLPSLAASASKLGFSGLDGTRRLAAMLQEIRKVSGTSEQAATSARDAFEKMLSPTVLTAAKKRGLDFGKILEASAKKGENGFEAIILKLREVTAKMSATQRDLFLSSIFTEADSRRAVVALIKGWDDYQKKLLEVRNSTGAVGEQLAKVTSDPAASIQRLSNAWNDFLVQLGRTADNAGATGFMRDLETVLGAVEEGINRVQDLVEKTIGSRPGNAWAKNVSGPAAAKVKRWQDERANPDLKTVREAQERIDELEKSITQGENRAARIAAGLPASGVQFQSLESLRAELNEMRQQLSDAMLRGTLDLPEMSDPTFSDPSQILATDLDARMAAAAERSMRAFRSALAKEAAAALAEMQGFAGEIGAALSFTARPSIVPRVLPPAQDFGPAPGGKAPGKQSSLGGYHAGREVRMAKDRLFDGPGLG